MQVQLRVLDGRQKDLRIKLPATQFVIGRNPKCHLRPAAADVSRYHCAIACMAGRVMVRDLKSRHGTYVNDTRIAGTAHIKNGDVLRVGPLRFAFEFEPSTVQGDSALLPLLRQPDEQEARVLTPMADTAEVDMRKFDCGGTVAHEASEPEDTLLEPVSTLAGEYLRDYLNRHKRPPA
jgi:pSer/pThr/pTyr-binding forkhead associated (FHA) protein